MESEDGEVTQNEAPTDIELLVDDLFAPIQVIFSPKETFLSLDPERVGAGAFVAPMIWFLGRFLESLVKHTIPGSPIIGFFIGLIATFFGLVIYAAIVAALSRLFRRQLGFQAAFTIVGISMTPSLLALPALILAAMGKGGPILLLFTAIALLGIAFSFGLTMYGMVMTPYREKAPEPSFNTVIGALGIALILVMFAGIIGAVASGGGSASKFSFDNIVESTKACPPSTKPLRKGVCIEGNCRDGRGIMRLYTGGMSTVDQYSDVYNGEFKNGLFDGHGLLKGYKNSFIAEGNFTKGLRNGKFHEQRENEVIFDYEFSNGLETGTGTAEYIKGDIWKIRWSFLCGEFHGPVTFISRDGTETNSMYDHGVEIKK